VNSTATALRRVQGISIMYDAQVPAIRVATARNRSAELVRVPDMLSDSIIAAAAMIGGDNSQEAMSLVSPTLTMQLTAQSASICTNNCFKAFKFTPLKLRSSTASSVQIAEIKFKDYNGIAVDLSGCVASNPGGKHPDCTGCQSELPANAIDGNINTKWLDFNKEALVITCEIAKDVSSFAFVTANDYPDRDPVQFVLSGGASTSGPWTALVERKTDFAAPTERHTETVFFPVSIPASPHPTPPSTGPAPGVQIRTISQAVIFNALSAGDWVGDLKTTYEVGWALAIGIYDEIATTFHTGCSVSSSLAARRGTSISFTASLPEAEYQSAMSATQSLLPVTLASEIAKAKTALGTAVTVPEVTDIVIEAPTATAPTTTGGSGDSSPVVMIVIVVVSICVLLMCGSIAVYCFCCKSTKNLHSELEQPEVAVDLAKSTRAGPPPRDSLPPAPPPSYPPSTPPSWDPSWDKSPIHNVGQCTTPTPMAGLVPEHTRFGMQFGSADSEFGKSS